jgi:hypothetical protein
MTKATKALVAISCALLAACGQASEEKVYGPEDYKHFSSYFLMDESAANEMSADGGTALVAPATSDPNAAILTAKALPGDATGAALTAPTKNSPGVPIAD